MKQVIVVRKDLNMRKGKIAAQAAHASMSFITRRFDLCFSKQEIFLDTEELNWLANSFKKICVSVDSLEDFNAILAKATAAGLQVHVVEDNGATEFKGIKTVTCMAIGPHADERFVGITDSLPLL